MNFAHSQLDFLQRAADALIVGFSLPIAFWIYYGHLQWSDKYVITATAAIPIFSLSAKVTMLYRPYMEQLGEQQIRSLLLAWVVTLGALLAMGYAFKSTHELSRITLGMYAILAPVLLIISRGLTLKLLRSMRARGIGVRKALIVGTDNNARSLAHAINASPWVGINLTGFVSFNNPDPDAQCGLTVIGQLADLSRLIECEKVDVVYVSTPMSDKALMNDILRVLGDSTVSIYLVPDIYTADLMHGAWITLGDIPTVCVIDRPSQGLDVFLKRTEDLLIAVPALLLLALPMLMIALFVRLTSPGPAIYKQVRYGISGKPIMVWKYRTMTVMDSSEKFVQATKNDARVTRLGSFLRRTSLDELPQLVNVLKGDMSIVGPRPHPVALNEAFRKQITGYMLRHKMKPGLTGLAQVHGYRGETDTREKMEHRVRYDLEYINNWSVWMDLAIIIKTPITLVRGENAY